MRSFVEATCGGPHEAIPSAFYNVVGSVYPLLNREMKNKSLIKILGILDHDLDWQEVQFSHTSYIREPLLLSDISIVQQMYWPGLDEGKNLIKKYNDLFCDFKFEAIDENGNFKKDKIKSDFLVGYSLLRKDVCNWGEDYLKIVNPKFLDKIIQGVVGMNFSNYFRLKNLSEEEIHEINWRSEGKINYMQIKDKLETILNKKISKKEKELKNLFPKEIHSKIDFFINEKNWADLYFCEPHRKYFIFKNIERYLEESL